VAGGARVNDCGPEPSLRTAPSSSSLPPTAAAFRFPRAYRRPAPHRPPTRRAPLSAISRSLGRAVCLGFFSTAGRGGRFCGARSRPAARAAFGSVRVVLRRGFWRFACGGVVHVNPFDVCLYDGLRAMHVPVLMPDLPRFTHPTIAGRRVAIEVSGGGVFVGWVECVPIGLSTRMYAARNPSSMHVTTRWVAREDDQRPTTNDRPLNIDGASDEGQCQPTRQSPY
jgi:hypothetical protein